MPSCRRASGVATARQQRLQRPCRARGGEPPRMPDVLAQADLEGRHGAGLRSVVHALETEPKNSLAAALASLGRAFMAKNG
jgi:hypothetical protein